MYGRLSRGNDRMVKGSMLFSLPWRWLHIDQQAMRRSSLVECPGTKAACPEDREPLNVRLSGSADQVESRDNTQLYGSVRR